LDAVQLAPGRAAVRIRTAQGLLVGVRTPDYALRMSDFEAVLIIDDDADVLRAARIALTPLAAMIETASTPDKVEDVLGARAFDAVLLDMNFVSGERDGRAGLDALARIRTCDEHLSVVLMTAYGGVNLAVQALKQGAVDFVLKPWRNETLINAFRAAAELTRARRCERPLDLESLERSAIERALAQHRGNISLAAAALGLSRPALYRRIAKHGLDKPDVPLDPGEPAHP
jgi:two-component system response regulator RegA